MIEGSSVSVDYNEWSDRVIDTTNELSVWFVFWMFSSRYTPLQSNGCTPTDEFVCVYKSFLLTMSVHVQLISSKANILRM